MGSARTSISLNLLIPVEVFFCWRAKNQKRSSSSNYFNLFKSSFHAVNGYLEFFINTNLTSPKNERWFWHPRSWGTTCLEAQPLIRCRIFVVHHATSLVWMKQCCFPPARDQFIQLPSSILQTKDLSTCGNFAIAKFPYSALIWPITACI